MTFLRGLLFTVGGWAIGFLLGMVLWMPSCIVASAVTGSASRGEDVANRLNYLPWLAAAVGLAAAIGMAIAEAQKLKAAELARRQLLESEELARQQRHREAQQALHRELIDLGEQSIRLFESMPTHLSAAESHLDSAEIDFAEGTFAPFWDSIERAATELGRFDQAVHGLHTASSRYGELSKTYEAKPPKFPLAQSSLTKLGVSSATTQRMQSVVRKAQRSFHFATIFEQRKTNQILVAGFTNLAQALSDMSWRLATSLEELSISVAEVGSTVARSMDALEIRVSEIGEDLTNGASDRAVREGKALEMLDNLQRGRKPSIWVGPRP